MVANISEKASISATLLLKALAGSCSHTKTIFASQYLKKVFDFEFGEKAKIAEYFESEIFLENCETSAEALIWNAARRAGLDAEFKAAKEIYIESDLESRQINIKFDEIEELEIDFFVADSSSGDSTDDGESWHPWDSVTAEDLEGCCDWLQQQSGCSDRSGIRRAVRLALEAGVMAQAVAAGCAATLQGSGVLRRAPRLALLRTAIRQRCARGSEGEAEALDDLRPGIAGAADTALAVLAAAGMPLEQLQALRERVLRSGTAGERELAEAVLAAGRAARSRRARDARQGRLL